MWWSIPLSVVLLNAMLAVVHYAGPKGIMLTWIPGRALMLVLTLLHKPQLADTLEYSWAATLVPVIFLITLHLGIRIMGQQRLPRFACAARRWGMYWTFAILAMGAVVLLIGFVHDHGLYIGLGIAAILLNILNVVDAPQHLEQDNIQLTYEYVLGVNIVATGILVAIHALVDQEELVWAGVLSNVPVFAIILMAAASLKPTPDAILTTGQHIYMMSYQIWPNMTFVGVLWGCLAHMSVATAVGVAVGTTLGVLGIQYCMIKHIL